MTGFVSNRNFLPVAGTGAEAKCCQPRVTDISWKREKERVKLACALFRFSKEALAGFVSNRNFLTIAGTGVKAKCQACGLLIFLGKGEKKELN